MIYRPEIDGLRALAVVPVILFHADFGAFGGGFVGVDVFFVLSGYLITSLLIADLQAGRFSLVDFYDRRARRILPALFVVLLASLPLAWISMTPAQLHEYFQSLAAVVFFVSNVLFWQQDGYFAQAAELKPLLHTWSLAVEEQFYIVFPLMLLALWRLGRHGLPWILLAMTLASFSLGVWATPAMPSASFYLIPTRAWELLAGALCALVLTRRQAAGLAPPQSNLAAAVGLVGILAALVMFDPETPFPGHAAALPVLGTCLLILFAPTGSAVARLLALRPLVGLGLVSYSAYLWHQPLFATARLMSDAEPAPGLMLALSGLSLALAWVSWRLVERPFRHGARGRAAPLLASRARLFGSAALVGGLLAAIGLGGHVTQGYRSLYLWTHPGYAQGLALIEAAQERPGFGPPEGCVFRIEQIDEAARARLLACQARHGAGVLALGDSHAMDFFGLVEQTSDLSFFVSASRGFCRPHDAGPECQYEPLLQFLAGAPGIFDVAIYEQAGFYLFSSPEYPTGHRRMFSGLGLEERVPDLAINDTALDGVVAYLERLALHLPVVWFGPRIEPHIPLARLLETPCDQPRPLRPNLAETFARLEGHIETRLAGSPVRYLSQNIVFGFDFPADFGGCDGLLWRDGDHLSALGQRVMGQRADVPALARALVRTPARVPED